jgi:hypothetical protein
MTKFKILTPDSYKNIKSYSSRYIELLKNDLQSGIVKDKAQDEGLVIYFDVASVIDLIRRGGTNTVYLAGLLGVHTTKAGENEFTISLLCADKSGDILPEHKSGALDGEEVWPLRAKVSDFKTVFS